MSWGSGGCRCVRAPGLQRPGDGFDDPLRVEEVDGAMSGAPVREGAAAGQRHFDGARIILGYGPSRLGRGQQNHAARLQRPANGVGGFQEKHFFDGDGARAVAVDNLDKR